MQNPINPGRFYFMSIAIDKGYLPGCVGRITELHAAFYGKHAGFGVMFEAKVARELAAFCERYDDQRDGLWLAVDAGTIQGALVIDGLHAGSEGAHLRWFITADEVRGSGLGTRLLEAAMEFCRLRGYVRVYLWTFEGLAAARHLYEKFDFVLVHQQRGSQWGAEVTEQRFEKQSSRRADS
jgi:GNAT superfamily N-acetyltransferase